MKFIYPVPMSSVALAALLVTPSIGHGQSILGGSDDFVLLSGTAITVAAPGPNTFSNGDVGAMTGISGLSGTGSDGLPVAYPPVYGTVPDGTIYLAEPVVTNALADLSLAQTKLKNLAETTNFTATPTLGGRTLTAGVYNFDVAADLTGTIFLDANFQNNVTWVFNIGTTLTTAAGAQVVFINLGTNGGIDNGLFWNAGAAVNFGAENIIAGNYLAGTAITFGTTNGADGSGSGRALAGAEITFDGPGNMDLLGTGGDLTGGLDFDGNQSGYVLLSGDGTYTKGLSDVKLRPGVLYNTANVVIDGGSADTDPDVGATLTVFQTIATLTGTNTYTGGTIIDAGRLTASSENLPTDGNVTFIDSNATGQTGELIFAQPDDGTFGGNITGDGLVIKDDAGALTLTGENTYTGGTTVNGGSLIVSTSSLPGDVALANDSALVFDQATDGTFAGVISGDGTLTKDNDGVLTLTGENTYVGTTTVAGGTLALSGDGTLGEIANALVVDSGTLDLGGTDQTVGAVNLDNGGEINNGTLTGSSYDSTGGSVGAALAGVGVVFTNTSGITTLTGANTYSGGTVVDGGTLIVNTTSLPSDAVTVAADSNLVFDQATNGSFGGVISGAGALAKENDGNLTLTGANTYSGGTTINGGSLTASVASLPADGDVALANDSGLILNQATDASLGGVVSGDGSLTKNNVGALTLAGANTYTGGTTINGGSLIASTETLPAAGDVAFTNNSSLVLNQATDGVLSGAITGAGSLTKNDAGALTLTGDNTYTGGTTVNGGTLIADTDSLPSNGDVVLANASGLVLDQATNGSFGGVISGDGSVTKDNTGELTLTGENTYTGGTTVTAGRLVASTSILPADQAVALGADGTLVLNEATDASFGGAISGPGIIEKRGNGALSLDNDTDSQLDVRTGSFVLTDNTVGATTLAGGSFLRGNGTINGNLFNGGTVSPGNSPGTIVVAGNYTQTADATLVMEIASAVSFDQLLIAGTADLDGTLQLDLLNGYEPVGEDFTIITAGGGVNGTFTPVTGSAALTAEVTYNANDVVVSFEQAAFEIFAGTPNQVAVAEAAQQSPALTTALNGVPLASQMPAALNALSPQGYQVWSDIAFAHTASLGDRLRRQPQAVEGEQDIYFEVSQSRGELHGDLDVNSSRYTSESGLVGINHAVSSEFTFGGFFEYTETKAGMGSSGSRTEIETKMPGVRAAWKRGAWFANAVVGYGFDDYESTREINFPGTSATAKSKTKGTHWLMDVSGGRRFLAGPVSLSPFAGLQASSWKADGFTESGAGDLNATVGSQSARSLRTQLGLEAAVDFTVGSALVRPHVRAAWIHELQNDHRSMGASLDGVGFEVETRDPQRDSARLSAGFDVAFSRAVSLYADYSIQTGHTSSVVGEWRAGLSIGF